MNGGVRTHVTIKQTLPARRSLEEHAVLRREWLPHPKAASRRGEAAQAGRGLRGQGAVQGARTYSTGGFRAGFRRAAAWKQGQQHAAVAADGFGPCLAN